MSIFEGLIMFVSLKVYYIFIYLCLSSFEGFWTWFGGFKVFMVLRVCEIES